MDSTLILTVELPAALCGQACALAERLGLSRDALLAAALEAFVRLTDSDQPPEGVQVAESGLSGPIETRMAENQPADIHPSDIRQGDIYWVRVDHPGQSEPGVPHPHVVVQDDLFNRSRVDTVLVCALTSNRKRANEPGNILLPAGEANLPRPSVLVVSQISAVEKARLGDYIGSLSPERVGQILAGLRFQQTAFFSRGGPSAT